MDVESEDIRNACMESPPDIPSEWARLVRESQAHHAWRRVGGGQRNELGACELLLAAMPTRMSQKNATGAVKVCLRHVVP